jgi:hypothetical protein
VRTINPNFGGSFPANEHQSTGYVRDHQRQLPAPVLGNFSTRDTRDSANYNALSGFAQAALRESVFLSG